jgi:hypothetical protein
MIDKTVSDSRPLQTVEEENRNTLGYWLLAGFIGAVVSATIACGCKAEEHYVGANTVEYDKIPVSTDYPAKESDKKESGLEAVLQPKDNLY